MAHEKRRPAAPLVAKVLLIITIVFLYVPIAVMLLSAVLVRTEGELNFTFKYFLEVFQDESLMDALKNSFIVGLGSSLLATILGTLAALGLHRQKNAMTFLVHGLSLLSLIFPEIVFALSLLSWFFVLKMELGLFTVVLAHISFTLAFAMMTVLARLASLDLSFEEAAKDLGASDWQIYRKIILPLLKPAILGGFILSFLLSFDDFLITYFVNGVGQDTLPVKLYSSMKMGITPKLNALSSLMFLMTLSGLIFFFRSSAFRVFFEQGRGKHAEERKEISQ
ncbi:ABC transporter permease [Bdellovibrio reynosensis]|uniref:ABC transporter permease n=1 Tax=Bdellovibrio reynosensis TaxID=2835041 RepID=A0ABY4CFP8_9BACT|nr:ABC transporter permease [Bdellovibrio reynosensis]UOF02491.1 ABC transporter permease [Bdellovibrio reynosensis]